MATSNARGGESAPATMKASDRMVIGARSPTWRSHLKFSLNLHLIYLPDAKRRELARSDRTPQS